MGRRSSNTNKIWRRYRINLIPIGKNHAYTMTIVGGTDAGRVLWPEAVLTKAKETGLKLDADGNLGK